jgi:hypothetical protein
MYGSSAANSSPNVLRSHGKATLQPRGTEWLPLQLAT